MIAIKITINQFCKNIKLQLNHNNKVNKQKNNDLLPLLLLI